jgi:hypothetical protein
VTSVYGDTPTSIQVKFRIWRVWRRPGTLPPSPNNLNNLIFGQRPRFSSGMPSSYVWLETRPWYVQVAIVSLLVGSGSLYCLNILCPPRRFLHVDQLHCDKSHCGICKGFFWWFRVWVFNFPMRMKSVCVCRYKAGGKRCLKLSLTDGGLLKEWHILVTYWQGGGDLITDPCFCSWPPSLWSLTR